MSPALRAEGSYRGGVRAFASPSLRRFSHGTHAFAAGDRGEFAASQRAWNGAPAIGSILLDRETAMTASIMALLDNGAVEVWESTEGFLCGYSEAEMAEMDGDSFPICLEVGGRRYRLTPSGDWHQHVMSGRVG